jgi:hypothetical protein
MPNESGFFPRKTREFVYKLTFFTQKGNFLHKFYYNSCMEKKIKDFTIADLINFCKENKKTIVKISLWLAVGLTILILIIKF